MPPCGFTKSKPARCDLCQPCRDFVAVAVDLLESVVACVRLGNIVAFDSRVGQGTTRASRSTDHRYLFVRCAVLPNWSRQRPLWVQDVSSFSSIEKISPALSSRLRTMQVRLETSTSLAS